MSWHQLADLPAFSLAGILFPLHICVWDTRGNNDVIRDINPQRRRKRKRKRMRMRVCGLIIPYNTYYSPSHSTSDNAPTRPTSKSLNQVSLFSFLSHTNPQILHHQFLLLLLPNPHLCFRIKSLPLLPSFQPLEPSLVCFRTSAVNKTSPISFLSPT